MIRPSHLGYAGLVARNEGAASRAPLDESAAFLLFPRLRWGTVPFYGGPCGTLRKEGAGPSSGRPTCTVCHPSLGRVGGRFYTCHEGAIMADTLAPIGTPVATHQLTEDEYNRLESVSSVIGFAMALNMDDADLPLTSTQLYAFLAAQRREIDAVLLAVEERRALSIAERQNSMQHFDWLHALRIASGSRNFPDDAPSRITRKLTVAAQINPDMQAVLAEWLDTPTNESAQGITPELLAQCIAASSSPHTREQDVAKLHEALSDLETASGDGAPLQAFHEALRRQGYLVHYEVKTGISHFAVRRPTGKSKASKAPATKRQTAPRKRERLACD